MFETPDGIRTHADSSKVRTYAELRQLHESVLSDSGALWNWPVASTLTTPSLARILWLAEIYDLIISVPGSILEFGVHFGTSSSILTNLRAIKEPHNYNRELFIFDTFSGFVGSTKADGAWGGDGKFALPEQYERRLDTLLSHHESLNPFPSKTQHKLYAGDASKTVNLFLEENPHTVVALAIFDMDLHRPTRDALTAILPRLTKGSILVFDQFNFSGFPGETLAVQEVLGLNRISLHRSSLVPHCAWLRFGD